MVLSTTAPDANLPGMQSDAEDVRAYIGEVPEQRREVIVRLAEACREELRGFAETMDYRMPSYSRNGIVEVAFASQKQHISLYVLRTDVLESHRDQLKGLSVGKGCIRYRNPDQVNDAVVRSMLRATAATTGPVC